MTSVVRVGDTVRRSPPPDPAFVHALLALFEERGWAGAPRFLGSDEQGREILGSGRARGLATSAADRGDLGGQPGRGRPPGPGVSRPDGGHALAAGAEVVCHNDLAPKNTVYRDSGAGLRPVAFIDWDIAAPGARIHDVAHVCWQYLDLGPGITDAAAAGQRIRLISDAYGLAGRSHLIDTILWWQDRCWRGIVAKAAAGDPAMARLRDTGAVTSIRAAHAWVTHHHATLNAQLA